MYVSTFQVKYYTIEQELKEKAALTNDYSIDDVETVCQKLYRDELLSAFDVDDITDPSVSHELDRLLAIMSKNGLFCEVANEFQLLQNTSSFVHLFSFHLFHIMHKCIQQQESENHCISAVLLTELRTALVENNL